MEKTDKSIHNICIAAIKKSTTKRYDFKWTRFYEENTEFMISFPEIEINLSDGELVICSTVIDSDNFSVLTTRKLITKENSIYSTGRLFGAAHQLPRDFKGIGGKESFTFGVIQLISGGELKYFIEQGYASMLMIHGIKTAIQTGGMTDTQMDKVARIWMKKK